MSEIVEQETLEESKENICFIENMIRKTIQEQRGLIANNTLIEPCKIVDDNGKFIAVDENKFLGVQKKIKKNSSQQRINKSTKEEFKKLADLLQKSQKITNIVPNSGDGGVYFFVANRDIRLDLFETFKKFIVIQLKDTELNFCLMSSPKVNLKKDEQEPIVIHKGEIIYVGESKTLTNRYREHLNNKLTGTASMKFGLREDVFGKNDKRFFDTYMIKLKNNKETMTELEKFIRYYYDPRFGK